MKKFVINLDRRADRKEHFLNNNSLSDVTWVPAVDGKELTIKVLNSIGVDTNRLWRDPFHNRKMTGGEIACFLSHRKAWTECANLNEPVMIFEDDAIITSDFDEQYYNSLAKEYEFIYLSRSENEPESVKSVDDMLEVPSYPYNLTAYIITPEAAKKILATNILNEIIPADEYIPLMLPQLKAVALKKNVAYQAGRDVLPTDVEPVNDADYFVDFTVHPITIGTDRMKCVPLNDSAALHSVYPKNLGTNVDWKGTDMSGIGGGHKVNLLRNLLKTLPDHDVVLFTDAYDVLYNAGIEEITTRYLGFNTKILFSAEADIWPDPSLAASFENHPNNLKTKYQYLNSGTFIGQVGELKKMLDDSDVSDDGDDQLFYQKLFLSGKYDAKLDYEGYLFQCNEEEVSYDGFDLSNPITNCCPCIYHGNGGEQAKTKFDEIHTKISMNIPDLYLPTHNEIDIIEDNMIVVDFMTQSQCEDLIAIADKHGGWGSLSYDKFPAQEIRFKELGLWNELEEHWKKNIYPVVERYWKPMEMYGLRDAFVMRYALDTQVSLSHHTDASMVTGSVKLNDDYEGADLVFHRQKISNKDIAVGRCILFPGMVTHGHECLELIKGTKYSLTMWSSRYPGDIL
jgi:GR25 family glycosyltransferase involved in LPS biosynthesis